MKIGYLFWAKNREAKEVINLDRLFGDYWSSNDHELIVQSQSFVTN